MSGVCSRHRDYDKNCEICNAIPILTREEYKEEAVSRTNKHYVRVVNMRALLVQMAVDCFLKKEFRTSFAITTEAKLKELRETGILNWD